MENYKIGDPVRITALKYPKLTGQIGFIKNIHYEGSTPIVYIIVMINQKVSYTFNRFEFAPVRAVLVNNNSLKFGENDLVKVLKTSKKPNRFYNKMGKILKVSTIRSSQLPYSVVFPSLGEHWFFGDSDLQLVRKGAKNIRTDLTNSQSFSYTPTEKKENETYIKRLTIKII